MFAAGPVHEVEAMQGSRAELPCDVAPVEQADRFVLVLWYKDGIGTPIYSHDSRGTSKAAVRDWADTEALGDRVYFDLDASPSALVVRHVRRGDEGLYRCRVDFKKSPTRNARSNLKVIIPPEPPTVRQKDGREVWTVVGPYNEGDSLDLTCSVRGGERRSKLNKMQNQDHITSL
ncbi:Immunoglobulin V-set domain [Trinorchestia longiramus]|nr:Immunoglobulin V-set domain [Trinorchestia longiramus]